MAKRGSGMEWYPEPYPLNSRQSIPSPQGALNTREEEKKLAGRREGAEAPMGLTIPRIRWTGPDYHGDARCAQMKITDMER